MIGVWFSPKPYANIAHKKYPPLRLLFASQSYLQTRTILVRQAFFSSKTCQNSTLNLGNWCFKISKFLCSTFWCYYCHRKIPGNIIKFFALRQFMQEGGNKTWVRRPPAFQVKGCLQNLWCCSHPMDQKYVGTLVTLEFHLLHFDHLGLPMRKSKQN